MNLDPMKLVEVCVVGFLFYAHMVLIGKKLDKLIGAVYKLAGQQEEETR